jgi:hypothetical protein
MTEKRVQQSKTLPVANYSPALARAVEWLGDRYLLAKPINSAHRSIGEIQAAQNGLKARLLPNRIQ